jgi:hypothetical protein
VTNGFGITIEMMVAILLALTIGYCVTLNRRLKLLKSDEQSLRATISELVTATEIAGLKQTVEECEIGLGARLGSADRITGDLDRSIGAGRELVERLTRIVIAGGGAIPEGPAMPRLEAVEAPRGAQALAAAAQAFAERLRTRVHGLAA